MSVFRLLSRFVWLAVLLWLWHVVDRLSCVPAQTPRTATETPGLGTPLQGKMYHGLRVTRQRKDWLERCWGECKRCSNNGAEAISTGWQQLGTHLHCTVNWNSYWIATAICQHQPEQEDKFLHCTVWRKSTRHLIVPPKKGRFSLGRDTEKHRSFLGRLWNIRR